MMTTVVKSPLLAAIALLLLVQNIGLCDGREQIAQPESVSPISNPWGKYAASTLPPEYNVFNFPTLRPAVTPRPNPWSSWTQQPRPNWNYPINYPYSVPTTARTTSWLQPRPTPAVQANSNAEAAAQPEMISEEDLRFFSDDLLNFDTNNQGRSVVVREQKKTTSFSATDEAPEPLLDIPESVYSVPVIKSLKKLMDNYVLDTKVPEDVTPEERSEEETFLNHVANSTVMQKVHELLVRKGKAPNNMKAFRDMLKMIWFTPYSRGGGKVGSSGFEHVFLAEIHKGQVSGLHNWLYFSEQEQANAANYMGYMRKVDFGNKGSVMKFHFKFNDIDKPVGSMFIGTSPEMEMALYTTCFYLRPDSHCPLKLGGKRVGARVYVFKYRGNSLIGSAFPEI